ncbi:hypothetical protein PMAYCL1PPCAC_24694, partial [Pristionchus mayeri]
QIHKHTPALAHRSSRTSVNSLHRLGELLPAVFLRQWPIRILRRGIRLHHPITHHGVLRTKRRPSQ